MKPYLRIGYIVRPHGVHGALKLMPETDDLNRFRSLDQAYIEYPDRYEPVKVTEVKIQSSSVIVRIETCNSMEEAAGLKGRFLCVDRAHAVRLPEGSYFICDLIGCDVYDTDGAYYGKITDVYATGANDVYEIAKGKLSVPALSKLIASVDFEENRMVFHADVLREVGLFED